jgi:3-hydroxybutyryl-CoA dehydrogenase
VFVGPLGAAAARAPARDRVRDGLARRAAKLELDAESIDAWVDGRLAGLREALSLDALGAEADVVIEAAIEDLELKQTIFRTLDAAAGPGTILATNTSALSIADIASAAAQPDRVLGLHFFNPAPLMSLVEVVVGPATSAEFADAAVALVEHWGKTPVRCIDSPGFIVNRVNRPFTIEALRMIESGESTVADVDGAMRAAGFPMGPFELMDLAGLDVNLAAARGVWEGLGRPEHLRPSPIQERLVDQGALGRKTDLGFYEYHDGRAIGVAASFRDGRSSQSADEIARRVVDAIGREAHRARDEGVATAIDIDTALRLGVGHPVGPFERERVGG